MVGFFAIFWSVLSVYLTWVFGKGMSSPLRNHLYTRFFSLGLSIIPVVLRFNVKLFDTGDFAVYMFLNFYGQFFLAQIIVFLLNRRMKKARLAQNAGWGTQDE